MHHQAGEFIIKMKPLRFIQQSVVIKHQFIGTDTLKEKNKTKNICTCGVVFIHWPAVNLKCCIATIPGKAYYMVFAIIYRCAFLFNRDVHCANIEDYTNLALLLKEEKKQMFLNCCHLGECSWPINLQWVILPVDGTEEYTEATFCAFSGHISLVLLQCKH